MASCRRTQSIFLLAASAIGFPLRLAAADPPCVADVKRLCADVPPGGGRTEACLQEHEARLSEACRKALDDLSREVGALAATCRWDIARFCSDVRPGGARVLECLERHEADLAPECKDRLRAGGPKR
jgi:hypothetical protein